MPSPRGWKLLCLGGVRRGHARVEDSCKWQWQWQQSGGEAKCGVEWSGVQWSGVEWTERRLGEWPIARRLRLGHSTFKATVLSQKARQAQQAGGTASRLEV